MEFSNKQECKVWKHSNKDSKKILWNFYSKKDWKRWTFAGEEWIASTDATCIRLEKYQQTIFLLDIILLDPIFC